MTKNYVSIKASWNVISRSYQSETRISTDDVHYAALAPGEKTLQLLDEVREKSVLELGCGGGQNCIALAKWGAVVHGIDISEQQIAFAKTLAKEERISVDFRVASIEDLRPFGDETMDVVISSYALQYVKDLHGAFAEVRRVLKRRGLFVFCDIHPVANAGIVVKVGKRKALAVTHYFKRGKQYWHWPKFSDGTTARFYNFHRILQDYFDALTQNGFLVEKLLEPEIYGVGKHTSRQTRGIPCYSRALAKEIEVWTGAPYSIIFKAVKSQ